MAGQLYRGCYKVMQTRWHFPPKLAVATGWPGVPDGTLCDVTPAPGNTYTRMTWPPRGRGRGESLTSPRRIAAKLRTADILAMRSRGMTWEAIAQELGYADKSGPWRAVRRAYNRVDYNQFLKQQAKRRD